MFRALLTALAISFAPVSAYALTFSLETNGGTGTAVDLGGGGAFDEFFVLVGSNGDTFLPVLTTFTATNDGPVALQVSGQFDYFTDDVDGPSFDPFGYIVDGFLTQLTDNFGDIIQDGSFSFVAPAGSVFGWYIASADDTGGPAAATVGADFTPVPLPAGLPLALIGVAAFVGLSRLRRAS